MRFLLEGPGGLPGAKQAGSIATNLPMTVGDLTVTGTLTAANESITSELINSASATAFVVGPNGLTNPVLQINTSVASQTNGLKITGNADGGGLKLQAISGGTNSDFYIDSQNVGSIILGASSGAGATISFRRQTEVRTTNSLGFCVGVAGTTNPTLQIDPSTTSAVTGLKVKAAAAAGGVDLTAISSGANEDLRINALGTGVLRLQSAIVATAGGAVQDGVQIGSIGVGFYTGTGAPTFSAMNGSIYVNSAATTTTTRMYVNNSGAGTAGTTWTNLTTAA
jgi:hypothetical protein